MRLRIGVETVLFKKTAIQWLGVWLDSHVNFAFHVNKKMNKAKAAEAQIPKFNKTYGFYPRLV